MGDWNDERSALSDGLENAAAQARPGRMFDRSALRAVFERAPEHVRQACLNAFDNPTAPTSYECGKHPGRPIPIRYEGRFTYTGDCPLCKGDNPMLSRFDSTDIADVAEAHGGIMAALARDKWTRLTHPHVWPALDSFAPEAVPTWWPRHAPVLGQKHGTPKARNEDGSPLEPGLEKLYEVLFEIMAGRRPGAYVYGEAGVGKTMAMERAAAAIWKRGTKVAFVREARLGEIAASAKSFSEKDHEWAKDATEALCTIPVLFVDEIGRSTLWSGAKSDWLEEFVERRWRRRWRKDGGERNRLQTVFGSNVPLDDLKDARGRTVVSRIRAICGPDVFVFGPDLRTLAG